MVGDLVFIPSYFTQIITTEMLLLQVSKGNYRIFDFVMLFYVFDTVLSFFSMVYQ